MTGKNVQYNLGIHYTSDTLLSIAVRTGQCPTMYKQSLYTNISDVLCMAA